MMAQLHPILTKRLAASLRTAIAWPTRPFFIVLLACSACVSGVEQEEAEEGELVGTSRPGPPPGIPVAGAIAGADMLTGTATGFPGSQGASGMPGIPVTPGTMPSFGNDEPCTPNTVVGRCEVCDASGQRIKPDIEPTCPPHDCGGNSGYERVDEDGRSVCYEIVRQSGGNSVCAEIGRCATEEEYCGSMERREVRTLDANPCAFMDGCQGQTPPRIEDYGEGTTCNRTGQCQGGGENARCSVQVPSYCKLDDATDALRFCGAGSEQNRRYCDYYVQPAFGGTSCTAFCEDLMLESCDQGNGERRCCWNNVSEDSCDTRPEFFACDGSGCENSSCTNQICRCFAP